uniref:TRPM-like domain-containing protein n=1 Tax=Globodera rostochiensis TaxID=31243 RepID=A0A914HUU2_GLORO
MDDDAFVAPSAQTDGIYTDTVGIFVEAQWGSSTQAGVQLCPAVFVPSANAIPRAVKHIYSRLAAAASELDQGVPEVLLSLVGTGNSFSFENTDRLVRGMGQLINRCTLWAVTSGEHNDPLANAMAIALRSTLTQSDSPEETLLIVVNSVDVRHAVPNAALLATPIERPSPSMTDARLNTFYVVWCRQEPPEHQMLLFRTATAIKLANPPPALLIGVPEDRVSSAGISAAPQASLSAPPISPILLPSAPSADRQPLPVVLFCGASLVSLVELVAYVQCGVPVLVVQDISELCVVLKGAFSLFQSAGFEHCAFEAWLDRELRMVALATMGKYSESEIEEARRRVLQLLLMVSTTEHSLLAFMTAHQMDQLGNQVLDLLVRSVADAAEMGRALQLAVKVGAARTVNGLRLEGMLGGEQVSVLLRSALSSDERIDVLASLLDQNVPLLVNSQLLLGWLEDTGDQYFFNAIILGHYFGIDCELKRIDEHFATRINRLMCHLCGGLSVTLFSSELFGPSAQLPVHDQERSVRALIVWALLIHRPELVRLFCAYSVEPMALALAMAKASRTLARKSRPWLFYDQPLQRLAQQLSQFAVQLLDIAYKDNPAKAYNSLCKPMSTFRQLTLTQFAFETNARNFLAHECCQRWVLRLLYGRIHLRNISRIFPFPNWLKILLSALFLLPAAFWVRIRRENRLPDARRPISPTVALLEDGRQMKKLRSSSQNSMHSMRSAIYALPPSRDDLRNPALLMPAVTSVNDSPNIMSNGPIGEPHTISPNQGMSTNDESTVTDSFLPSASQVRGNGADRNGMERKETVQQQPQQQQQIRVNLRNDGSAEMGGRSASRRQSPDRRSLMFCDGMSTGGAGTSSRRRSRSSRLFGIGKPRSAGNDASWSASFRSPSSKRVLGLLAVAGLPCPLLGRARLVRRAARLRAVPGLAVAAVGMGPVLVVRFFRWALFDLCTTGVFLLALVALRVARWSSSAYVIRACWALFLLYECYKTMFIYVPISHVFGPMLVRIRLMITRDLVNFLLLILLVLIGNAIAIKAVLYPDLSASPQTIINSVDWTFQQLFTTDLSVLEQSDQVLAAMQIQGVLPRLLSWPILFALFARTAKRVEEEADQIWKYQLYSLTTSFSVRPCLPPPFTPLFLLSVACCRCGIGGLACILRRKGIAHCLATDHPDMGGQAPNSPRSKYFVVYKNPSVPVSRARPLCGYWRRLAIAQWKNAFGNETERPEEKQYQNALHQPLADKAHLLISFSCLRQQMDSNGTTNGAKLWKVAVVGDGERPARFEIPASERSWLRLQPHYRPNSFSKPADQFPAEVQKHVDEHSAKEFPADLSERSGNSA